MVNMEKVKSNPLFTQGQKPWIMLLALIGISLGGILLIGQIMALLSAMVMTGGGLGEIQSILSNPTAYPEHRTAILVMQGMSSFGGFIIAPLIFYYVMVKGNLISDFFKWSSNTFNLILVTILMVFSFMIVNTVFIEWNANIKLPEYMSGFESWATDLEESMADITKYLTNFESTGYFLLTLIIIAVIPGVGEEILFRGYLQNIFRKMFKNDHVAVWMAAILFSAIHFQFYGFVPRMLLGALFGYLYLWTGNLLIPIVAHFLNNSISLLALFVYQKGLTDFDAESTEALPLVYVIIFSAIFIITIVYFKNNTVKSEVDEGLERSL
jgi:uncharacterized protein